MSIDSKKKQTKLSCTVAIHAYIVTFLSVLWFFLAHQSRMLKWAFWSKFVCCHCCRCRKLFTFSSSSQEPMGQFQPNLLQSILGWWGLKFNQNGGHSPFPWGVHYVIANIHWRNLKIFSSRSTGSILLKLSTKYPWVKGIQICSNEGPCPFPRGDNYEIANIHRRNSKYT